MNSDRPQKSFWKAHWKLLVLWGVMLLGAYFYHFTFDWHHGKYPQCLSCPAFAVIPIAIAWGWAAALLWILRNPISLAWKMLLSVVTTAVATGSVLITGFMWLLMHMAP